MGLANLRDSILPTTQPCEANMWHQSLVPMACTRDERVSEIFSRLYNGSSSSWWESTSDDKPGWRDQEWNPQEERAKAQWAQRKDPAGCCIPAAPAEPGTIWRCSRSHTVSSFESQIFFLVVSSNEIYVRPSKTSFELTAMRYIHHTPVPNHGQKRELRKVWLSRRRGWMPFRVTLAKEYAHQQETFTGAIPVCLNKSHLPFHSVLKSRKISTVHFIESVNPDVLVCCGLTWTPTNEPQ